MSDRSASHSTPAAAYCRAASNGTRRRATGRQPRHPAQDIFGKAGTLKHQRMRCLRGTRRGCRAGNTPLEHRRGGWPRADPSCACPTLCSLEKGKIEAQCSKIGGTCSSKDDPSTPVPPNLLHHLTEWAARRRCHRVILPQSKGTTTQSIALASGRTEQRPCPRY